MSSHDKVLHRSNLWPWRRVDDEDSPEQPEKGDGSKEEEEGEIEMPDMTEVLRSFGFDDTLQSTEEEQKEEVVEQDLTPVSKQGMPEREQLHEEETSGTTKVEVREATRFRHSQRLDEQKKRRA